MASAGAYVLFHCSSRELQSRAGFDGWVMLLREDFETEDQAWPQEKLRLAGIAKRKMRRLEAGGVELDMLQLVTSCHLLLDPPRRDREEERIWCIEFFRGKMYDFVVDDRELVQRLNSFQDELLQSARRAVEVRRATEASPSTPQAQRQPSSSPEEGGLISVRGPLATTQRHTIRACRRTRRAWTIGRPHRPQWTRWEGSGNR